MKGGGKPWPAIPFGLEAAETDRCVPGFFKKHFTVLRTVICLQMYSKAVPGLVENQDRSTRCGKFCLVNFPA